MRHFRLVSLLFLSFAVMPFAQAETAQKELSGFKYNTDSDSIDIKMKENSTADLKTVNEFKSLSYLEITAGDIDLTLDAGNDTVESMELVLLNKNPLHFYQTISALKKYKKLTSLRIASRYPLKDINIQGTEQLKYLRLRMNQFSFRHIKLSPGIKEVSVYAEKIDLAGLGQHHAIHTLKLSGSEESLDFSKINQNAQIKKLTIDSEVQTTLKGLENFHHLEYLDLTTPALSDVTALDQLTSLKTLSIRQMGSDQLPEIHNRHIATLALYYRKEFGPFSERYIRDISNIGTMKGLKKVYFEHEQATDYSPLLKLDLEQLSVTKKQPLPLAVIKKMPHLKFFAYGRHRYEGNALKTLLNTELKTSTANTFKALINGTPERGSIIYGEKKQLVPVNKITLDTYNRCHSNHIAISPALLSVSVDEYIHLLKHVYRQSKQGIPSQYTIESCQGSTAIVNHLVAGE
ncbi:hypothetical protein VA7868_03022 [Vibrio aerogenes CECT 7868]|uniref:Leucine Rich repeats (2 copies) n=1 Tax=Vibrio aerogenes CECT 7868 TaxID=1216006 RepID=A0A1M5ZQB6_9VIBR|nr:hypothetical protein [Vibrio aerogenes]SHI26133.1 hypothetical protein VA7868_03022 [Vibrio aerogenes CECT 7868]